MSDYLFGEVLNRRANLTRPQVAVDGQRLAREADYELVRAAAPVRVRPARVGVDAGLLGQFPQATAVGYAQGLDVRPGDRLGVVRGTTLLTTAAQLGATQIEVEQATSIEPGRRLHLRDTMSFAEAVAQSVAGNSVTLREPLTVALAGEASVELVDSYEALGAEDVAGEGHHVRVALREVEV